MKSEERDRELDSMRAELVARLHDQWPVRFCWAHAAGMRRDPRWPLRVCIRRIRALDAVREQARRPSQDAIDRAALEAAGIDVDAALERLNRTIERCSERLATKSLFPEQAAAIAAELEGVPPWKRVPPLGDDEATK